MAQTEQPEEDALNPSYARDTLEFNRILNLFDAVFAIAMTLLVLNIDIPDVPADRLASALVGQIPQFVSFIISFTVVAHIWWQHHKLLDLLGLLDSVMVAILFALLGVVVLMPFATGLVASAITAPVAMIVFILLMIVLNIALLLLAMRAQKVNAWRIPITLPFYYWLLAMFVMGVVVLLVAMILSIWFPIVGLAIVAGAAILGPLSSRITYSEYL